MTGPVLLASAELTPLARVGGLAEAVAGLVKSLRSRHAELGLVVVVPDYGGVELENETHLDLPVPAWVGTATARRGIHPLVGDVILVDVPGMARTHPYTDVDGEAWPDNDRRFFGFSAALVSLVELLEPSVLHLNDWHTALVTGLARRLPPTVLTIHTLGYQGVSDDRWLDVLERGRAQFEWYGSVNPLAGAIDLVDRVIAVSPNYADEILTEEAGMGLHSRLRAVGDHLVGIRNGIDTTVWDPAIDPELAANYGLTQLGDDELRGKDVCRRALLEEIGWDETPDPIIGLVGRLVEQKGIDLLVELSRYLHTMPARLVVLGSGERGLADALRAAAQAQPDRVWFREGYDADLGHRIFAGADLFVMPSRFEPCGLAQMQAMAYGTLPVVTDVGGLHDTVVDVDRRPDEGTGFVSESVDVAGLLDALHRGVRTVLRPRRRAEIQRHGMSIDWSWAEPAAAHAAIYTELAARCEDS